VEIFVAEKVFVKGLCGMKWSKLSFSQGNFSNHRNSDFIENSQMLFERLRNVLELAIGC